MQLEKMENSSTAVAYDDERFNESLAEYMARQSTRDNLVENLTFLMADAGWNQVELQRRSGVSQKTISNILRKQQVPTIELADKLAAAFGLQGWHIIMPHLPRDLRGRTAIAKLYEDYMASSDDGRKFILSVADREAQKEAT